MYEAYYGFREKPFSLLPNPSFLYLNERHRKVLNDMEKGIASNNAGFTVLTGDIGSGKSTLLQALVQKIPDEFTVGMVNNIHKSYGELLQWVLMAFDLEYKGKDRVERFESLISYVLEQYDEDRPIVLMIDEAQNMTASMFEELRTLSNVNSDTVRALQLVLVGQPELLNTLKEPNVAQFTQRITASYQLTPLNRREAWEYIRHRLRIAGGDPDLFDDEACVAIWYFSDGVPRVINTLCDQALVYNFAEKKRTINVDVVKEVVRDRHKSGIYQFKKKLPNRVPDPIV